MLKRLLDLMGAAEAACRRAIGQEISSPGICDKASGTAYKSAIDEPGSKDFAVVYTYALDEGIPEEVAFVLGATYADEIAEGMSKAYSIIYAVAYSVACSVTGASEQWAHAYAQACTHAIAARESMGFAAAYGHAIADGTSPEDALAFARRYAV